MAARKKPVLPSAGAAFAFPVGDGRYSVCRVLLDATHERAQRWKGPILVACSAWIGHPVPRADTPELRPILHPTHHAWAGAPNVLWVSDPVPPDFIPIGTIEPTPEDQVIPCLSFGSWRGLALQPLLQWRWDHEREAVLAQDAAKASQTAQASAQARKERQKYLSQVTLEALRSRRFFPGWKKHPPAAATRASRQIMADTVERLIALGPKASRSKRLAVLRACIESFNRLDAEMRHFIDTVAREDICDEFEALVHACGLGAHEDLADRWREW